jgi:vacuolar protein sorting-associated protein 13A/C
LTIDLPWQALGSQPARVHITDVYLLARARPQGKVDPEEDDKREQAAKQDRLRSAEAVDQAATQLDLDTNNAKPGRAAAIISKVIDNLQIHVSNIHVRYEDGLSTPEHPLAAGFTLDEFRAVSTDSNWIEAFISSSAEGVHKVSRLVPLCCNGLIALARQTPRSRRLL